MYVSGILTSFGLTQKLFRLACFPRITGPQSDHELNFNLTLGKIVDVMLENLIRKRYSISYNIVRDSNVNLIIGN